MISESRTSSNELGRILKNGAGDLLKETARVFHRPFHNVRMKSLKTPSVPGSSLRPRGLQNCKNTYVLVLSQPHGLGRRQLYPYTSCPFQKCPAKAYTPLSELCINQFNVIKTVRGIKHMFELKYLNYISSKIKWMVLWTFFFFK